MYVGVERSYDVESDSERFGVALVQCDVASGAATVRRHHSWTERHPMRVAVSVSVPKQLWLDRDEGSGRLIMDHGSVVTVWAAPADLESMLHRWPRPAEGVWAAHNERLRDYASQALRLYRDLEAGWMQQAGRSAVSAAEQRLDLEQEPDLSL